MKLRKLSAAIIASIMFVMPFSNYMTASADDTEVVFSTFNISGVTEGDAVSPVFEPERDIEVFSIMTYHWNHSSGSPAGTISVYDGEELIGTWESVGSKGMYNTPDANWTCYPCGLVLKAGHTYKFGDSDPGTWSYNSGSAGCGFVEIRTGSGSMVGITPSDSQKSEEKQFGSHTYQRFDVPASWDEAKAYCEAHGGHLVTITSEDEQIFVEELVRDGTMDVYWLGGTAYERTLEWVTGEKAIYENWADGQPDNAYEGYHVAMNRIDVGGVEALKWGDTDSAGDYFGLNKTGFVCEWGIDEVVSDKLTVTFDAGAGSVSPTEMNAETGKMYGALPIPELEGREFEGWALGYGGRIALNVKDANGKYIVRLTPADGDTGWDKDTPTYFKLGYSIFFDVTINDALPINVDINDKTVDSSKYTIAGNRIYGEIKIDESFYHPTFGFLDINTDKLCENYTLNSFFVSPTDQYMVTSASEVTMTEDHTLHAVWKTAPQNVPITADQFVGIWEVYKAIDTSTKEEIENEYIGAVYTFNSDGSISSEAENVEDISWVIKDGKVYAGDVVLVYDGTNLTYERDNGTTIYFCRKGDVYAFGDPNGDGTIDARDASMVLVAYAKASTGKNDGFTEQQRKIADVNGDDNVDAKDASTILAYYALVSTNTGEVPTLKEFAKPKES